MGPLDAIWHLLNFVMPAFGVSLGTALMAKLLWRHELAGVRITRLASWGFAAGVMALVAGLVIFGRDGKMATYGAVVLATALALWWAGFMRR
jgi:hypothetical protein